MATGYTRNEVSAAQAKADALMRELSGSYPEGGRMSHDDAERALGVLVELLQVQARMLASLQESLDEILRDVEARH